MVKLHVWVPIFIPIKEQVKCNRTSILFSFTVEKLFTKKKVVASLAWHCEAKGTVELHFLLFSGFAELCYVKFCQVRQVILSYYVHITVVMPYKARQHLFLLIQASSQYLPLFVEVYPLGKLAFNCATQLRGPFTTFARVMPSFHKSVLSSPKAFIMYSFVQAQ